MMNDLKPRWQAAWLAWDQFWFAKQSQESLVFLRICTGLMMAYIHAIWLHDIDAYMGPHAWVNRATMLQLKDGTSTWSYLWYIDSIPFLIAHELLAIVASLAMATGLLTRWMVPLAWFLTLMVCHRMTGMLFGLDQVVMMISMYLMLAPCGAMGSLDARIRNRRGKASWLFPEAAPTSMTQFATRLLQIHLCIVYLFGGLSKLRGEMWQDGSALWFAAASYEYQSLDLTWLGYFPALTSLLSHGTLFWETFYVALVWPRVTRPIMIGMAVMVHGGIALFMGMVTFGSMMIVANAVFVSPATMRRICQAFLRWREPTTSNTLPQNGQDLP